MLASYVVISPCRNEAEFMRNTLDSVVNQTVLPTLWVIVDDGYTDDTPKILLEYVQQYSFIRVVTRDNKTTVTEFLAYLWTILFFSPSEYGSHQERWGVEKSAR